MTSSTDTNGPLRVLIAGGGVAGLEALLALTRLARDLVDVELVSPAEEFVDRSMLVAEPFGSGQAARIELSRVTADAGVRHRRDALASVDPGAHRIRTTGGEVLAYDALLVAVGARTSSAIPGALDFGDEADRARFADLLRLFGHSGTRRLAFVVPPGVNWSIAAYELALLTAAERDARRLSGTGIRVVTHESAPLAALGDEAGRTVAGRLDAAGIELLTEARARSFTGAKLATADGSTLDVDAVVALPALTGPAIPGLPTNAQGFVPTDVAMNVAGLTDVWAAGDATAFPIKQGGLAAQEADVAARAIAVRAGAHVPLEPFRPVLRAALITGGTPEFMLAPAGGGPRHRAAASGRALWWPPQKVAGRFLGPVAADSDDADAELADVPPPADPDAAADEHSRIVYLVLAAAEDDAAAERYDRALAWLGLIEDLNLVLPPEYVARRHEWRLRLQPESAPDPAARRIDPRFDGADAAMSDLRRRVGWLRRSELETGGDMAEHLAHLDAGLRALEGRVHPRGRAGAR